MATQDLQTFLEDRLRSFDPTMDLSQGSPAQTQVIAPIVSYLGTDPFETDIKSFILDRFAQEFPNIYAGDPGVISDTFIKPLILLLEPFKRETLTIKRNQSLQDPSVLSDSDADALVANVFDSRNSGGFAVGIVRVFFSNPINTQVELATTFSTSGSLNYMPTNPVSITAEEMVFNRQGALYFMDIPVKAESAGSEYNVAPDSISSVRGLTGVVRVTNPRAFLSGSTGVDTSTFVAQARESLTERSLVNRRGAVARLSSVFQGETRAIQVIGAKDSEMQRDILVATSPGHSFLSGTVSLYGKMAYVRCRTLDGESSDMPQAGDTLFVYLDKYSNSAAWASLPQATRFVRLTVEEILIGPTNEASPYQVSYVVRWSGSFPAGVTLPTTIVLEGGFAKTGTIQVSSIPGIGSVNLNVNNKEVHVYGHSDIYVRPVLQNVSKSVLLSLVDDAQVGQFKLQRSWLQTIGEAVAHKNRVVDLGFGSVPAIDFVSNGVTAGDLLTIETGDDAGTYVIGEVTGGSPSFIYLTQNLTKTSTVGNIRYRITKNISLNPFDPKIPKIPFGNVPNNDLQTTIGSNLFRLTAPTSDLLDYGVKIGDTFRIKTGIDAGDFTITGFDATLGGQGILVDRSAGGSESGLVYEVFTSLDKVLLPLVRIRELLVLDSSKQSTGIIVPPADPVAIVPNSDMTAAQVRGFSQRKSGYVLPSLVNADGSDNYVTGTNVNSSPQGRYSLGFDPTDGGIFKAMLFANATQDEFLFPGDAFGSCSYFLATSENSALSENFPPVDPKPGDALTLKSGPNAGSYLIQSVRKFKYKNATGASIWAYFIKIYGTFPVDVFRQLIKFIDTIGGATQVTKITNSSGTISFPDFFVNNYSDVTIGLGNKIRLAMLNVSASPPDQPTLQAMVDEAVQVDYEWGDPAYGTLRSYFTDPVLVQQHTAKNTNPTVFSFTNSTGDVLKYRPAPTRYEKYELVPPRLETDSTISEYPRDITPTTNSASFTDTTRTTMFAAGVVPGDVLSIHQEMLFHGSSLSQDRMTAVATISGSTRVTAPTASGSVFDISMVGDSLFIDEGQDTGCYKIVAVPDGSTLMLDKPLTRTTPTIITQGTGASWGFLYTNKIVVAGSPFTGAGISDPLFNKWVTVYGIDSRYQGSYEITNVPNASTLELDRGALANFPALDPLTSFRWVVTATPQITPKSTTLGTELSGLQPIRVYNDVPVDFTITAVSTDPLASQVTFVGVPQYGTMEPYRAYRNNVRRITPTEMEKNTDGSMFYVDTEVVSFGPNPSFNIKKGSYLTIEDGTFDSYGYRHVPGDNTLTYSTKESGSIIMPTKILPINSLDSLDNLINLVGVPLQVSYEQAPIVQQFQDFLDSTEDRVTAANMLARHFLPSYVSYDVSYVGGSSPSVIAKDIISYINNRPVETPIDVSEMEKLIDQRGGNPQTPTTVFITIHDWDRKRWLEFSQNEIGGTTTDVPYNGTPRVSYFVPGNDVSGQSVIPTGERINLTQL